MNCTKRRPRGQIELRGCEALRTVRPADMVGRYLRTMDDDLFHIIGAEWAPRLNIADTVKGGVIASDARIKLQSNLQRLESFAEAIR